MSNLKSNAKVFFLGIITAIIGVLVYFLNKSNKKKDMEYKVKLAPPFIEKNVLKKYSDEEEKLKKDGEDKRKLLNSLLKIILFIFIFVFMFNSNLFAIDQACKDVLNKFKSDIELSLDLKEKKVNWKLIRIKELEKENVWELTYRGETQTKKLVFIDVILTKNEFKIVEDKKKICNSNRYLKVIMILEALTIIILAIF